MAIQLFIGLTGSGKSYGAVKNALIPVAKIGRTIVTNIPLKDQFYKDFPDCKVITFKDEDPLDDPDFFTKFSGGEVFLIDEAMAYWPAGKLAKDFTKLQLEFFSKHRHKTCDKYTQEIILICQNTEQLAAFVKGLINTTVVSVKLENLGSDKFYHCDVYTGTIRGFKGKDEQKTGSQNGKYNKSVYQYYETHSLKKDDGALVIECKPDKRGNLLTSKSFILGSAFVLIAVPFCSYGLYDFFNRTPENKEEKALLSSSKKNTDTKTALNKKIIKIPQNKNITLKTVKNINNQEKTSINTVSGKTVKLANIVAQKAINPAIDIQKEKQKIKKYSKEWRIVGDYHGSDNPKDINVIISHRSGYTKTIKYKKFCEARALTYICNVEGHVISFHSGKIIYRNDVVRQKVENHVIEKIPDDGVLKL